MKRFVWLGGALFCTAIWLLAAAALGWILGLIYPTLFRPVYEFDEKLMVEAIMADPALDPPADDRLIFAQDGTRLMPVAVVGALFEIPDGAIWEDIIIQGQTVSGWTWGERFPDGQAFPTTAEALVWRPDGTLFDLPGDPFEPARIWSIGVSGIAIVSAWDADANGGGGRWERWTIEIPEAASFSADITTQGAGVGDVGYGVPDGNHTGSDIALFVNAWVAGSSRRLNP